WTVQLQSVPDGMQCQIQVWIVGQNGISAGRFATADGPIVATIIRVGLEGRNTVNDGGSKKGIRLLNVFWTELTFFRSGNDGFRQLRTYVQDGVDEVFSEEGPGIAHTQIFIVAGKRISEIFKQIGSFYRRPFLRSIIEDFIFHWIVSPI